MPTRRWRAWRALTATRAAQPHAASCRTSRWSTRYWWSWDRRPTIRWSISINLNCVLITSGRRWRRNCENFWLIAYIMIKPSRWYSNSRLTRTKTTKRCKISFRSWIAWRTNLMRRPKTSCCRRSVTRNWRMITPRRNKKPTMIRESRDLLHQIWIRSETWVPIIQKGCGR